MNSERLKHLIAYYENNKESISMKFEYFDYDKFGEYLRRNR